MGMVDYATTSELMHALLDRAGLWADAAAFANQDMITIYARSGVDSFSIFRPDLDIPNLLEIAHYRNNGCNEPVMRAAWVVRRSADMRSAEDLAECLAASIERHMERRVVD